MWPSNIHEESRIEVSAFAIIVWYTYRNREMLKFMALVRTIVQQAGIWFIGIIVAHIYIQANFHYTVRPFVLLAKRRDVLSMAAIGSL